MHPLNANLTFALCAKRLRLNAAALLALLPLTIQCTTTNAAKLRPPSVSSGSGLPLIATAPHSAVVPVARTQEALWQKVYDATRKDALEHRDAAVVLLGDSITQRYHSYRDLESELVGGRPLINAGIFSDGTQHLLWRLRSGQLDGIDPRLIVILIGTNNGQNTAREIAEGVYANAVESLQRFPHAKILLLGILPSGEDPLGKRRTRNKAANALIRAATDGKRSFYLDAGDLFVGPDGLINKDLMPDALHPSRRGYELWTAQMAPAIRELLSESPSPSAESIRK